MELRTEAGVFRRVWGQAVASITTVILFTSLILCNVVQMLSLLVWPFSKPIFRKINCFCAGSWWGLCAFFQEKLYGIKPFFTGDILPEKENAFLIVNHQSMTDILVLFGLALRKKMLWNLKFFVKDILKYVPGMGWGMLFLDCLFLKRNWEQDQDRIRKTFGKFGRENIPVWIVSFVEGTRLTAAKLKRSRTYAKEHGLPVLDHVLLPRTKGFVAAVKNLRGHLDAVYDITIVYPKGVPRLWQVVQGFVGEFHLHVTRFEMTALPQDDAALSGWLLERFIEKDRTVAKLSGV